MPLIETPDEIDDSLRELFCSFDSSSILTASARSERRTLLSRRTRASRGPASSHWHSWSLW